MKYCFDVEQSIAETYDSYASAVSFLLLFNSLPERIRKNYLAIDQNYEDNETLIRRFNSSDNRVFDHRFDYSILMRNNSSLLLILANKMLRFENE